MRITKLDAIKSLCPTVELTVENNSTITSWSDKSISVPAEEEIQKELDRLQAVEDWKDKRRNSYPSLVDQLDLIYHSGIDAWKAKIKETKDKYPKP